MKGSNLRNFVTEIIEKLDSAEDFRDFHSLKEPQKNEKFALFVRSLNNPILQLYSQYNFKNFIGDMCSDLKYNLKNPSTFEESLALFLVFRNFSKTEVSLSFDFLERTPLYRTLQFLLKSLSNSEENITYVLNIQDLLFPVLDYVSSLTTDLSSLKADSALIQELSDLLSLLFRFLKLFFSLKSLAAWKALIAKNRLPQFLVFFSLKFPQYSDVKTPLIEILEILTSLDAKGQIFLKETIFHETEVLLGLWRGSMNIDTLMDFEQAFALFRFSSFLGSFPLDYISYSRLLKQIRGFLSTLLKSEGNNKAKIFKNITPKLFSLSQVNVKITGSRPNAALEKVYNKEVPNTQKIVFLPEVFEGLMGFLEELADTHGHSRELLYIIELFFNEIMGLLSQNDWNFAIIKENDYDILKKLINLIGKSRESSYNKQLLDLIQYIFTVFSRKSDLGSAGVNDLLEMFKALRLEDCEDTRRVLLLTLEKILEFFKADFGSQELNLLWTLCDLLLDVARKEEETSKEGYEEDSDPFAERRESVESLINLIKIVLKKNKAFLVEIKNNSFFQDLVLSLDYRSHEFIGLILFLLKEELQFKPNSLHIYCEVVCKELGRAFQAEDLQKLHCLLVLVQRIFSVEALGFRRVFREVFLENGDVLQRILKGFEILRKKKGLCVKFLGFLRDFIAKSQFFRRYFEENPHLIRNFIVSQARDSKIAREIIALSYLGMKTDPEAYFPKQGAELVFAAVIAWVLNEDLIPKEELKGFIEELRIVIECNEENSSQLLESGFFNAAIEKTENSRELMDLILIALRNTNARVNSMKIIGVLEKLLCLPMESSHKETFFQGLRDILAKNRFSPSPIEISSEKPRIFSIPRVKYPDSGNLSLFQWIRVRTNLNKENELSLLEISSAGESYLRIFQRDDQVFLVFLNYPETRLENSFISLAEWTFLGISLSKNKEMFTINLYLNGKPTDTRFYLLEKPLEMVFRMLRIEVSGGSSESQKLELGAFFGFKANVDQNQALGFFLSQDEGGFGGFGDVNEELLSDEHNLRGLENFQINIDELLEDLFICIESKAVLDLRKQEGLMLEVLKDEGLADKARSLRVFVLLNSSFEVNASYNNKASPWLHGVYVFDNENDKNGGFALKQLMFSSGFCEKVLRNFSENTKEYYLFLIFLELYKSLKILRRELTTSLNGEACGFLNVLFQESAGIIRTDDLFELVSVKSRLRSNKLVLEFLWNKEILVKMSKGQRKSIFSLILTRFLNENTYCFEGNLKVLREPSVLTQLFQLLFKAEVSDGCECDIIRILYILTVGSNKPPNKIDDLALHTIKRIIDSCFLPVLKSESLDKLLSKADVSLISPKKLDSLLEISLDLTEKLQQPEDRRLVSLSPEFFLRILALRSLNAPSPTESSTQISRLATRNLLLSMRNCNFAIDFQQLPVLLKTLQPFFPEQGLISRDILKTFKEDLRASFSVVLLNLYLKGLEIIKSLFSACQLLDRLPELEKALENPNAKDFIFLNELLRKAQGTEFIALQTVPELSSFIENFFDVLESFSVNSWFLPVAEPLFRALARVLLFTAEFFPAEKAKNRVMELMAQKLGFLLKKPSGDSLLLIDKLVMQLQREVPEDFTVGVFNQAMENGLKLEDEEFRGIYGQFSQFLLKFLRKSVRRARQSEMKQTVKLVLEVMKRRDTMEAAVKKPKDSFLKTLFKRGSEPVNELEFESLSIASKQLVISLMKLQVMELKEDKEARELISFLNDHQPLFFEGKYEKDDFTQAMLHVSFEAIKSPSLKNKTRITFLEWLQTLTISYRPSLKRVLKTSFSTENTEKLLDLLSAKDQDPETLIEKAKSIKIDSLFQPEFLAFQNNSAKAAKDETPLIFTAELKFFELSKDPSLAILEPQSFSSFSPSEVQLSFRDTIEKNLKISAQAENKSQVANYLFIEEKSKCFGKKLDRLCLFSLGHNPNKQNTFTFAHARRGFGCEQQLVYLKRTPDFVAKEQLSAKLLNQAPPLLESFFKTSTVPPKQISANDNDFSSSESEDEDDGMVVDASVELDSQETGPNSLSSKNLGALQGKAQTYPRKYSQKSAFWLVFLEEMGVFGQEFVDEVFEIGYLKEREAFIDALLFLCKDSIIIVLGFYLNEWGLPEPVNIDQPLEKARFLKKKAKETGGGLPENPGLHNYDFRRYKGYKRVISIAKNEVRELHTKRYWLRPTAIEIYTMRKSFFLVLNIFERDFAYRRIIQSVCGSSAAPKLGQKKHNLLFTLFFFGKKHRLAHKTFTSHALIKLLTPLWKKGLITNFEYLVLLNTIAGRTHSDLSQYPVFPWILANYTNETVDLLDPSNYRELSKPIGALTEERAKVAREKYDSTSEERSLFPAFHYGSHYSSAVLVLYYLIRLMPYSKYAINLQGGHFDLSDRLFSNFCDTWTLANNLDYKELIPEVYYLPEFLLNVNNFDFGKTQTDLFVRDIALPIWSRQDPRYFIGFSRKALESQFASQNLNKWIDLVFGFRQRGQAAVEALNLFYFLTYEDSVDLEMYTDPLEKSAILDQINEYGQTPKQLFKKAHPARKCLCKPSFLGYSLDSLMRLHPSLFQTDESTKKFNEIHSKIDCFLSQRRSSLLEASPGIRSSKAFAQLLGNLLEQPLTGSLNLLQLKPLVKKLLEKQDKNIESCVFCSYEGQSLVSVKSLDPEGNLTRKKLFNWKNAYNCLLLLCQGADKDKPQETEVVSIFPLEIPEVSASEYLNITNSLFLGSKTGLIAVYEYQKELEPLPKPSHKKSTGTSSVSKGQQRRGLRWSFFLDREDIGTVFRQSTYIELNKKVYVVKKGDYSSIRSSQSGNSNNGGNTVSMVSKESQNVIGKEKSFSEESLRKSRALQLKFLLKGAHNSEVQHLKIIRKYLILLSSDREGTLAFWDISKGTLLRRISVHHYQELSLHELIKQQKDLSLRKSQLKRQKIVTMNVCEETGDFIVVSRNYVSVYSLNGVLLAIEQTKEQHFSSGLLLKNRTGSSYEDLYIITGHKTGILSFWVLKLNESNDKPSPLNPNTESYALRNEREDTLKNLRVSYRLHCIYRLFTSEYSGMGDEGVGNDYEINEKLTVIGMSLSFDQKKLYTYHKNKKVLCWKTEEMDQNSLKKCIICGNNFGILDKKNSCASCGLNMCVPCSKQSRVVPEVSLKEVSKVCEKCFKREAERKVVSLYDNY